MKKKNSVLKVLGRILLALIIVFAVIAGIYHKAAYAIFKNLTVEKYQMDESSEWDGGTSYIKVPYAEASENQYLDLYVPDMADGEKPQLFVLIHGGGFISNDSQSRQAQLMYRYFRDHGFACATINYRLAQEAPFPGAIEDCKTAIRFLRAHADEYGFDADTFPVWGESAGGFLANMCAFTNDDEFNDQPFIGQEELGDVSSKPAVLVDYYGEVDEKTNEEKWKTLGIPKAIRSIANSWLSGDVLQGYENIHSFWFRQNVSEMTEEEYNRTAPIYYLQKNDQTGLKTWIVHGDCDITVPYLQSTELAELLAELYGEDAVSMHLVPGMGHASDPLYSDELLGELAEFLRANL